MRSAYIYVAVFVAVVLCGVMRSGVATATEAGTLLHEGPTLTRGVSANEEIQLADNPHRVEKHHKKRYEPEEYDRSRYYDDGRRRVSSVVCKSRDYQYNYCPMNRQGRRVRIARQLSDTRCVRGDNWGSNRNGIWVDRGCGGRFVLD